MPNCSTTTAAVVVPGNGIADSGDGLGLDGVIVVVAGGFEVEEGDVVFVGEGGIDDEAAGECCLCVRVCVDYGLDNACAKKLAGDDGAWCS